MDSMPISEGIQKISRDALKLLRTNILITVEPTTTGLLGDTLARNAKLAIRLTMLARSVS